MTLPTVICVAITLLASAIFVVNRKRRARHQFVMPKYLPPMAKIEQHIESHSRSLAQWEAIKAAAEEREQE